MSEHVPECLHDCPDLPVCICDELHAFGKRVYADAYRSGREDACTAVAIFLALNGFHPNEREWVERMKAAVMGGPM